MSVTTITDLLSAIESLDRQLQSAVIDRDEAQAQLDLAEGKLKYFRNAIQAFRMQLVQAEKGGAQ